MNARPPVQPEEVRNVAARELLRLRVEQRRPQRLRARAHVLVRPAQADANGRLAQTRQAREHVGDRARVTVEEGERAAIGAGHREQIRGVDRLAEIRQHAPDAGRRGGRSPRTPDPRPAGASSPSAATGRPGSSRRRGARTPRAPRASTPSDEVLPVQIGDAEPAPERERAAHDPRERAPAARPKARAAARASTRSTSPPSRARERKNFRAGRKPNASRPSPSRSAASSRSRRSGLLRRQQQPLPDERARLGDAPGAPRYAAPEVVRVAEGSVRAAHRLRLLPGNRGSGEPGGLRGALVLSRSGCKRPRSASSSSASRSRPCSSPATATRSPWPRSPHRRRGPPPRAPPLRPRPDPPQAERARPGAPRARARPRARPARELVLDDAPADDPGAAPRASAASARTPRSSRATAARTRPTGPSPPATRRRGSPSTASRRSTTPARSSPRSGCASIRRGTRGGSRAPSTGPACACSAPRWRASRGASPSRAPRRIRPSRRRRRSPTTRPARSAWTWPTERVLRHVRALAPAPGAWTEIEGALRHVLRGGPRGRRTRGRSSRARASSRASGSWCAPATARSSCSRERSTASRPGAGELAALFLSRSCAGQR